MVISGNFDTYEDEIAVVTYYVEQMGYEKGTFTVSKFGGNAENDAAVMSASDITVKLPDNRTILFEVKQESYNRFSKWGQLGIDFISVFQFKSGMTFDRKVHGPKDYDEFIKTVDIDRPDFKWGKLQYSTAHVWLFYVQDPKGGYCFCNGYDYEKIRRDNLITFLRKNCQFAVNKKDGDQLSRYDTWQSAVFFLNPEDIKKYLLTPESFAQLNNFSNFAL